MSILGMTMICSYSRISQAYISELYGVGRSGRRRRHRCKYTRDMHPVQDLRLIALLPYCPSTIDKALVGVILAGLTIIGGLLLSKAHSLDHVVVEYEELRRLYAVALFVLTALIQISQAFT